MIIYVDVDDTLIRTAGTKRIPMPDMVRHVRELKEQGAKLYCWSTGGAAYAEESARDLGLADCFQAFLPKPQVMIDDQPINEWRHFTTCHPSQCAGLTLPDYRLKVEGR